MVLPTGCEIVGPGLTIMSYVLVDGQPFKVEMIVKVTVFGKFVELVIVNAGIEFAFPDKGLTLTPIGTVVADHEKVVPLWADKGTEVVEDPEQMVCEVGFKAPSVGAVPIPKVWLLTTELAHPFVTDINRETVFEPPVA